MGVSFQQSIGALPQPIQPYLFDINRLIEKFIKFDNVYSILLFGSYARGEYNANSDCDLLIILKDEFFENKPDSFLSKLEQIFLSLEFKHQLKFKRSNLISSILNVVEKTTGMFVSHFLTRQSAWEKQTFHKIFNVNQLMSILLAPGDIVLKNMSNSYIVLYGENPKTRFKSRIGFRQEFKSLLMNEFISVCSLAIYPLGKTSIKYSMEAFKWSIRNSYLYMFDKPAELKKIMKFFKETGISQKVFDKFMRLRSQFYPDISFALKCPWLALKIHTTAFKYRKLYHKFPKKIG
jgi:predicted nucleotidyltransferase